jgi:hypothetical protein
LTKRATKLAEWLQSYQRFRANSWCLIYAEPCQKQLLQTRPGQTRPVWLGRTRQDQTRPHLAALPLSLSSVALALAPSGPQAGRGPGQPECPRSGPRGPRSIH